MAKVWHRRQCGTYFRPVLTTKFTAAGLDCRLCSGTDLVVMVERFAVQIQTRTTGSTLRSCFLPTNRKHQFQASEARHTTPVVVPRKVRFSVVDDEASFAIFA